MGLGSILCSLDVAVSSLFSCITLRISLSLAGSFSLLGFLLGRLGAVLASSIGYKDLNPAVIPRTCLESLRDMGLNTG